MVRRSILKPLMAAAFLSMPVPAAAGNDQAPRIYTTDQITQFQLPRLPDVVPGDPAARRAWARALAFDATLYGTASVLEYVQLYRQAVDAKAIGYTGFNRFAHGRKLAEPGYQAFKSPNADTLYSNAWLDLQNGPVLFTVPDTQGRYYTANFIDMYANASNIGARTHGTRAGRYLIATTDWQGEVPAGVTLFRVGTPHVWILLRILATDQADMAQAAALQDAFKLTPLWHSQAATPDYPLPDAETAMGFFRILDFVLRTNGYPATEKALVERYRGIGIAGTTAFDVAATDAEIRAGLEAGFIEARRVINASLAQGGRTVNGWRETGDKGRYGSNFLYRSVINTLGTGSNVSDESTSFTTFADAAGKPLDGTSGSYRLVLSPPPPARFFWSVTVYNARTRELHPNPIGRYLINDRTPGLIYRPDGSLVISLQTKAPADSEASNWLPIPAGPFFLGLRAYGPMPAVTDGKWAPNPVERRDEDAP
ncbi:MAG: hypothetical protein RLZZ415_853 [Pseudomonadota bacterium]|jgi:hypothetical protein